MSFTSLVHCRLCAELKHKIEIVDLTSNLQTRTEIIDKLAIFYANTVDFTDQTLPETICTNCQDSVRNSFDFFKQIKESQLVLKGQNIKYSSKQNSEVKEEKNLIDSKLGDPFDDEKSYFVECSDIKTELDDKEDSFEDTLSNREANVQTPEPEQNESIINEPKLENCQSDYECTACGKSFPTWKDLQRHTSTDNDHFPKKRTKATIEELTCDICFKVFSIPAKLRYHKVKHTNRSRDYVCDVCGKAFYAKDSLNTHKIIHNPETQDCKICKKTFISLIRLRKHLKTHDVSKPFECNECHRKFRMKYQLGKHMVVHSDVFPYSCEFCKKGFRFKNVLKTHENIHTGAKPFVCSVCGMDFTNWSNCNKHMMRKHGVSLAKRVKTAHGMMPLNQETMKPKEVDVESVKWSEQMCKPRKRGRKKQEEIPT